ncbi:hypothetical protein [Methylocapsa aurea]|uniref:hypothetical protein n=1 Tax=Methylocapsa aurea TaxID=663610 RepID=UPI0012EC461B|nr:hypothetical protein [Methylocapsa aurea]
MKPFVSLAEALSQIICLDTRMRQRLAAFVGAQGQINAPLAEVYDQLVARLVKARVG